MARLVPITFTQFDSTLSDHIGMTWSEAKRPRIETLPQIFWENGEGWPEANLWALERATASTLNLETVKHSMKHLHRYASFLEAESVDWRHFPIRREQQPLRKFRGHLIQCRAQGLLAPATVTACMASVIQFYRYAASKNFVEVSSAAWEDRASVLRMHDSSGFQRTLLRSSSDLKIPNRRIIGSQLEDALMPLRSQHMCDLLSYTHKSESAELHLMLSVGFFTGARLGTITTLTRQSLTTARDDALLPKLLFLPVGPGTGVATKFNVSGRIMVPQELLADLQRYASSTARLLRSAKAAPRDKDVLFLTSRGRPYSVETVAVLVSGLRSRATRHGLNFMSSFKFHQSRATFGTWLMTLLLEAVGRVDAVRIVRDAMLHKDERTTLSYVRFIEDATAKAYISAEFSKVFTGLENRNWNAQDV